MCDPGYALKHFGVRNTCVRDLDNVLRYFGVRNTLNVV